MKYCPETDYCETFSERTYMRLLKPIESRWEELLIFQQTAMAAFENLKTISQTGKGKYWTDNVNDKLTSLKGSGI